MKKKMSIVTLALLVLAVVMVSGCTSSTPTEKLVGKYNINDIQKEGVFGSDKLIVQLPNSTSKVRVVYNLKAENNYGTGSNGNLGVSSDVIDPNSGQDPIGFDNEYLEGGAGETINGSLTFDGGKTFYYSGSFASGTIEVYATT